MHQYAGSKTCLSLHFDDVYPYMHHYSFLQVDITIPIDHHLCPQAVSARILFDVIFLNIVATMHVQVCTVCACAC